MPTEVVHPVSSVTNITDVITDVTETVCDGHGTSDITAESDSSFSSCSNNMPYTVTTQPREIQPNIRDKLLLQLLILLPGQPHCTSTTTALTLQSH